MRYASIIVCIISIATTAYSADRKSKAAEERLRAHQAGRAIELSKLRSRDVRILEALGKDLNKEKIQEILETSAFMIHKAPKSIVDLIMEYCTTIQPCTKARTLKDNSTFQCVAFSRDSKLLAAVNYKQVKLFQAGKYLRSFKNASGKHLRAVTFCSLGKKLFAGGEDLLIAWDVVTGKPLQTFPEPGRYVSYLAYHPTEDILASAAMDQVTLWDTDKNVKIQDIPHSSHIVTFGHKGKFIATVSLDSHEKIQIWTFKSFMLQAELLHDKGVSSLDISPDDSLLISTAHNHAAYVWDIASGLCLFILDHAIRQLAGVSRILVSSALFHPTAPYIITVALREGKEDHQIVWWDTRNDNLMNNRYEDTFSVPVNQDYSGYIREGFDDGFWLIKPGRLVCSPHGHWLTMVSGFNLRLFMGPLIDLRTHPYSEARAAYDKQHVSDEWWKQLGKKVRSVFNFL